MPIPLTTEEDWSGREAPFSTDAQREALDAGDIFYIADAKSEFPDRDGKLTQIAFLIDLEGVRFVFTQKSSWSREAIANSAMEAAAAGETLGPCRIKLVASDKTDDRGRPYSPRRDIVAVQDTPEDEDEEL